MKSRFQFIFLSLFLVLILAGVGGIATSRGWWGASNDVFIHQINERPVTVLLEEMLFVTGVRNTSDIPNWSELIQQGASFEGVYRGIVYSSAYRALIKNFKAESCKSSSKVYSEFINEFMQITTTYRALRPWTKEDVLIPEAPFQTAFSNILEPNENPLLGILSDEQIKDYQAFYEFYEFQRKANEDRYKKVFASLFQRAPLPLQVRILSEQWLTSTEKDGWPNGMSEAISHWNRLLKPLLPEDLKKETRFREAEMPWRAWVISVGRDRAQWEILYRIHLWFRLSCET